MIKLASVIWKSGTEPRLPPGHKDANRTLTASHAGHGLVIELDDAARVIYLITPECRRGVPVENAKEWDELRPALAKGKPATAPVT